MATRANLQKSSQSRVFMIADRAAPNHKPLYKTLARATALSWSQGSITPIRIPNPNQYGSFLTVDKIRGQAGLPGLSVEFRSQRDLSDVLALVRKGCPIDLQIHIGACKDPSDFDAGWEKILVLEDADFSNYTTSDLGTFDADGDTPIIETIEVMGTDYYEIGPIAFEESATSQIVQAVVGIAIADERTCGACGLPSDGCQRVFVLQTGVGASPGVAAELVYTQDGGGTWEETNITSLAVNTAPIALAGVGPYLAVLSNADASIHIALIADILEGDEAWTEITSGISGTGEPNAIFSLSRTASWIVGDSGYIYFTDDISAGVVAQQSGDLVAGNLYAIHGLDEKSLLAGGASNAILVTGNGGVTWSLVAGPSGQGAADVTAVAMITEQTWVVGYSDGEAYVTYDSGAHWTQKILPGTNTRVDAIKFSNQTVGYMTVRTAAGAKVLRTINGGYSWYVAPENRNLPTPTAVSFGALAACEDDPNVVWAGGLRVNAGDGILVQGA